jgi:spore photoproduct lyase
MYPYKAFSHIYIEKSILDNLIVRQICEKFDKSTIVEIEHYKDVFNRSYNEFALQKKSIKIILANKTSGFLYPISELIQNQNEKNYFYYSFALNSLYDCK